MEKQGFCKKKVKIVHHKSKTVSVKKEAGFVQYRHVNGLPKCRTERNGGAAMKERKRSLAAAAGGCVLLASLLAAGCAAGTETVRAFLQPWTRREETDPEAWTGLGAVDGRLWR